ncbi:MAG: hypothetical protein ABIG95_05145 [Candidatus Woesearchaeota archaeon]
MKSKIIYTDNGRDIAITGKVVSEDQFFVMVESKDRQYKIGKKSIVCVKRAPGEQVATQ